MGPPDFKKKIENAPIAKAVLLEDAEPVIPKALPNKQRHRPGPPGADAPIAAERDLADAALILSLIQSGSLRTDLPPKAETEAYFRKVENQARLSMEEEAELARRVQVWGDIDARNCLVMSNIGLVHLVANQFCRPPMRYEDLVQEGTMGLIRATETFEPDRGARFSTYSVYWIRAKIQRLLQKAERDDVPTITGAELMIDGDGKKRKPRARKLSIERTQEEDDSRALTELLPSDVENPEVVALKQEKEKVIQEVLKGIVEELGDPRLHAIIRWRLLADEPETLSDLGARLNLSREGARLLESRMLKLAKQRLNKWRFSG